MKTAKDAETSQASIATKATDDNKTAGSDAKKTDAKKEDAEALLKADHRQVEELFQQYEGAGDSEGSQKSELAKQICRELIVHTKLEEDLFYPACREKDVEDDIMDEAQVEHDGAKILIAELMNGSPDDEFYDAKVTVLSEYIKHHVGEEEKQSDGIFAKARKAGVDMSELGSRIQARKTELMSQIDVIASKPPKPRSLDLSSSSGKQTIQESYAMARYSNDRDRDEQGRFMSDDDNGRRGSSRGSYSSRGRDSDEDRGNGQRSSRSIES